MKAERDAMTFNGTPVLALEFEERSDETPSAAIGTARVPSDPKVVAKPTRRQFTAEYRLRIVGDADCCTEPGEVGRMLCRESLYSSHLSAWRKQGAPQGLAAGAVLEEARRQANPLDPEVRALEAKVARLEKELHTAHTILDVQGKVAGLLGDYVLVGSPGVTAILG